MNQAQEDLLVLAAQAGNSEAFSFLCQHYQRGVMRFAYKLCSDPQVVQDAVQNTWLKLAKNLHRLDDPRAFKSWLFKTVRWSVYDLMRTVKREKEFITGDVDILELAEHRAHEVTDIARLIEHLPDIDKQVIDLFYLEEMQIAHIADVLQIPVGTVKSRLHRARKTLQEKVEEQ